MKVILLNGPPGSGKDSAAIYFADQHRAVSCQKFAQPISDSLRTVFGINMSEWARLYSEHKEEPLSALGGLSPRQAMIWMSEEVIKPKFGKGFFGKSAANRVKGLFWNESSLTKGMVTFSDCGFPEEVKVFIEEINPITKKEDIHLVYIHKEGCTYEGDSRMKVEPEDVGLTRETNYHTINNNGTKKDLYTSVGDLIKTINKEGYKTL